jgi:hypothetical protein
MRRQNLAGGLRGILVVRIARKVVFESWWRGYRVNEGGKRGPRSDNRKVIVTCIKKVSDCPLKN